MKMGECKYCEPAKDRKNTLYEDETVVAMVPEKQATDGHVQVFTKKHQKKIQDMDDKELEHAFYTASFAASSLFENLEAHGTNIIANSGSIIKEGGHFHIDVLARKTGDELNFIWKPNKPEEEEMKEVQKKIKDKCDLIGKQKPKEIVDLDNRKIEKIGVEEKKEEKKEAKEEKKDPKEEKKKKDIEEDKESYLVKQLKRIP